MIKQQHTLLIILLSILSLYADQERFIRILKHYTGYDFTHEKRNITLNYATNNNPEVQRILKSDTAAFREKLQQFNVSFQTKKRHNSPSLEKTTLLHVGFNSIYTYLQHLPEGSEYYLDTLSYLLELNGKFNFDISRHFIRDGRIKTPFIELLSAIHAQAYYTREKGFDPDAALLDLNVFKEDFINTRQQNATIFIDISPGAGIGKQVNVLPVYQVFRLEEELLKKKLAHFPLSDKTLIAIAELLAKNNSYAFKKLEKTKKFKNKIDSIIIKDEAVGKENLRYISPLDIKKILLCNVPLLMAKPRLRLFTTSRMIPMVERNEIDHPYDNQNYYTDTTFIDFKFRYEHLLGMDARWGVPLTKYWFLDLYAVRNLLSTDKEIDFYDQNNNIEWDEVLDIRMHIQTSFWITNWLLLNTGAANLPTWLGVPHQWPYRSFFSCNLFVEDYLSLTATLSYYNKEAPPAVYVTWPEPASRQRDGLFFHVDVSYNF